MEFVTLVELFELLSPIKHKYRIVGKYIKYLKSIATELNREMEVEGFKKFLLSNPNLHERKFTNSVLKVNRECIYLDNALSLLDENQRNIFWEGLLQTDRIMFPNGRPADDMREEEPMATDWRSFSVSENHELLRRLHADPLLSDVMNKVMESEALASVSASDTPADVSAIMSDPKIMELAQTITSSLTSGNYNEDSFARTLDTITTLVGDDADPKISTIITFLKKALRDLKAKRPVDVGGLMNLVSSMDTGNVDLAPLMAQILGGAARS